MHLLYTTGKQLNLIFFFKVFGFGGREASKGEDLNAASTETEPRG